MLLQQELDAYAKAGIFDDAIPAIDGTYDAVVLDRDLDDPDGSVELARLMPAGTASLGQHAAGVLDVVLELGDERVDPVELALAAQEVGEAHLGRLAVEVVGRSRSGGLRAASWSACS